MRVRFFPVHLSSRGFALVLGLRGNGKLASVDCFEVVVTDIPLCAKSSHIRGSRPAPAVSNMARDILIRKVKSAEQRRSIESSVEVSDLAVPARLVCLTYV